MPRRIEPANLAVPVEAGLSGETQALAILERTRMMAEEFEAGARVNWLAGALRGLSKVQLPFIEDG